jgi:hypothetical protein
MVGLALAALGASGCAEQYFFTGFVYDGAVGGRLTNYTLELEYYDRVLKGSVNAEGRYNVGPLLPRVDYTIRISSGEHRSFLSHNAFVDVKSYSQHWDGYLFPSNVVAPAVRFDIRSGATLDPISGTVRLIPTAPSVLYRSSNQRPAGIAGQVWDNDDDLQFRTVTKPFQGSIVEFAEGELVYGVSYRVDISGVPLHPFYSDAYTAGVEGDRAFVVPRTAPSELALAFTNVADGRPVPNGEAVFVFNQPIELDPTASVRDMTKAVDDSLVISSPDRNNDGNRNALRPVDPVQTRGTTIAVEDNLLRIRWNPSTALETTDSGDPIQSVTYGALDRVRVRPSRRGLQADVRTVSELLPGSVTTITVAVAP